MGTLSDHIAKHVPLTVTDKSPGAISDRVISNNRADQAQDFMGGSFDAQNENGVIGKANPSPGRINARINGIKVQ